MDSLLFNLRKSTEEGMLQAVQRHPGEKGRIGFYIWGGGGGYYCNPLLML